jgi:hypothetical protein
VKSHDLPVQVEVLPVESAHLTPSSTDRGSDPDERSPIRVAASCLLNQSDCFVYCGRCGVRRRKIGALSSLGWVDSDPAPANGTPERAAEDPVALPDRRLPKRLADMWPARSATVTAVRVRRTARRLRMRITVVSLGCPVLNEGSAVAMVPAPAQLGVERVKDLGAGIVSEPTHLELPEQGFDVLVDDALVVALCMSRYVEKFEVPVEEMVDGRRSPGMPLLVDLIEQAGKHPFPPQREP